MFDRLVTLGRYATISEAYIVKGVLAEEGIVTFVSEEETVNLFAPISLNSGGVELKIAEKEYDQAIMVLEEAQESGTEES